MARRRITITLGQGAEPFDLEIIDQEGGKRYVLHGAFVSRSRVMGGAPVPPSSSNAPDDGWPEDMGGHAQGPFRVEDFWKWVREAAARGAGDPPPKRTRTHYVEGWRTLLGMPETLKDAEKAFRKLALERHPDRGGSHEQMVELNAAMKAAREVLR